MKNSKPTYENIQTYPYVVDSLFWNDRLKTMIVDYIPHKVDLVENNRTDWKVWARLIEIGKKNKGLPYDSKVYDHNWADNTILNTFESMCLAVMIDPQGDAQIIKAQDQLKKDIERWIPCILDAVCEDGYFCTKVTMEDGKRWSNTSAEQPEDTHEGYLMGYFLETAITHFKYSNKKDSRLFDTAKKMADLWVKEIGDAPKKEWVPDHEGIELALAKFGDFINQLEGSNSGDKYIKLAKWLVDKRGRTSVNDHYRQNSSPLSEHTEMHGHAVMAAYFCAGTAEVERLIDDDEYLDKLKALWHNAVDEKMYLTASVGQYKTEEYGPSYVLPNESYSETCASCGLMFFSEGMNNLLTDGNFSNISEIALYNGILGSKELNGVNWYYRNPLDAHELREIVGLDCCMTNLSRVVLQLPTWMYSKNKNTLLIKQYIGSTINVGQINNTDVQIVQKTNYPYDENVSIKINVERSTQFAIKLRLPNRNPSALYITDSDCDGVRNLKLNGKDITAVDQNGYITIDRVWSKDDVITFTLPLKVQRVRAIDKVVEDKDKVALKYGPIIYNGESYDMGLADLEQLVLEDDVVLTPQYDSNLLGGVMKITGKLNNGKEFIAIPNFARLNRGEGRSIVWFNNK